MTELEANGYLKCGMVKAASKKRSSVRAKASPETLGDRIRRFRKVKGLTQTELGEIVGISQRLMTYYETQGGRPAADLLARFAEALDVSTDVLLGRTEAEDPRASASPQTLRLWRRLRRIEEIPPQDQKAILKMIDALADRTGK
jgi:transcriptional regulator with XRE-family HTH domain